MAADGNGDNEEKDRTWVKILVTFLGSSLLSGVVTHWYDARHRDEQLHQLQVTAAYTKLQDTMDAFDRGLSSAVLTFQIALENPKDKNFQKNLPDSIAVVTEEIKEVDRAGASLKIDPAIRTELAPVLVLTGTDLAAMKNDPRKTQQLIEHYHNSTTAVINDVRNKIEEKLKQLPALDNGTPTTAKPESDEKGKPVRLSPRGLRWVRILAFAESRNAR